ncbi:MAG: hypothetical protein ABR555_13550 [Pyrinomonadaceae bacterium]
MKRSSALLPSLIVVLSSITIAQTSETRPRTVAGLSQTGTVQQRSAPIEQPAVPVDASRGVSNEITPASESAAAFAISNPATIQSRIVEAERLLKSLPMTTAMATPAIESVTVAALDRTTSRIHLISILKQTFLTKGSETSGLSSLGTPVVIRVVRANGVNTALLITTANGQTLTPLVVQFPIEKGGLFKEMAYYTSAHPALLSNDLVRSGQAYVHNMIELANKRLREKGVLISPQIVDVAERLCIVEHVDHDRFRLENRLALFNEIYSLYALNELDTYRYSVSFAGAGGMVQMIPWAYNLERERHPGVGLLPDFVIGMRNHANALQAMLLYMQDTWNELSANQDVQSALRTKLATPTELLAAGYNSNAARLPSYLRRGGEDWKILIPRETQMYLQIYKTFEGLVSLNTRITSAPQSGN